MAQKSVTLVLLILPVNIICQPIDRNTPKETGFVQQLATIAPASANEFRNATAAMDRQDWPTAVDGFRNIVAQAPRFSPALRRLGVSLVEMGQRAEGLQLLDKAVTIERSPENLISLAQSLAFGNKESGVAPPDLDRALDVAKEAAQSPAIAGDPSYLFVIAQLGLQAKKLDDFHDALTRLQREYPNVMQTHYFAALDAAMREQWTTAEDEIHRAGTLGLSRPLVESFLNETGVGAKARAWRWAKYSGSLVGIWVFGLIFLLVAGKFLSSHTLASIETADPNSALSPAEASIRKRYRSLIRFAGTYYYISLPVVIFLVVAVASSIIYGFLLMGRLPIRLTFALGAGAIVTIWKMVQSLLVKVQSEDPGQPLERGEAPALWAVTDDVAGKVGTRPVDEIRMTPGTDMAVYERGSRQEREQDRAKRVLLMGVGLLNGFEQPAFRAVLAHEYGHFSHRDTAGGDVALRVNQDIMKFAVAMAQHGQAVWYNIAFWFLRLYHFIFRRITHGATRLQEVLADRVAARLYGPSAFEQGLTHVIRRSVEFQHFAGKEIEESRQALRPLRDLYALETPAEQSVEEQVAKALAAPTTEDNTHPGPGDRFRLAGRVASPGAPLDPALVWDLFPDRSKLTTEMSALIQAQLNN